MGLLDNIKSFINIQKASKVIMPETSAPKTEEIIRFMAPIFREVPPDSKAGQFIAEGLKSWVFVAQSAIADDVATANFGIFKKTGKDWIEDEESPLNDFFEKPNGFQTKEEHFWLTVIYLLSVGEAPWLLDSGNNPSEMVLVDPHKLTAIWGDKGVDKYKLRLSDGTDKEIESDRIIFNKLPSYKTPFRGMGKVSYITQAIDINNYIEQYLRTYFFNDASPGAVLETPNKLSKPIIERVKTQFQSRHRGVKNAHKLAVLDNGLKFNVTSPKINELAMKEIDEMIRDKVLSAFKVPKTVAGITEDVSRANGENSDRVFARRAVKPLMKMLEGQINKYLLPKFTNGNNTWFEFENPVQADQKMQADINKIYIDSGVLTVNEVREELGLQPIEEVNKPVKPAKEEPVKSAEKKEKKSALVEIIKDMMKEGPEKDFTKRQKLHFHDQKIMLTDKIEEEFKRKLNKFWKTQKNQLLNQLSGKSIKQNEVNFDEQYAEQAYVKISTPFLEETVLGQSAIAYAFLGLHDELPTKDKLVAEFIKNRTLKVGKSTAKTTKDDIQSMLRNWAGEEGTISDLRRSLRDYFDDSARVDAIVRTEVSRAANFSTVEVYKRVGVLGKEWLTARDERTCEFCAEMDGKTVKINDSYFNDGDTMRGASGGSLSMDFEDIESPPLHVNCRCTMIPVFHEEEIGKYFKKVKTKK